MLSEQHQIATKFVMKPNALIYVTIRLSANAISGENCFIILFVYKGDVRTSVQHLDVIHLFSFLSLFSRFRSSTILKSSVQRVR